ncbi:fimbrial assembly protein [Citrobacter amalonaticus]|uniref:Fimbrial assembly protein n=1 Tax=Citrobacter amalonaticus TaxID=35703 RepID=A0A2S4S272_CITAM|nr:fimbria/pilus outer membrane usher protein [Citrobacter amalonaticus]POT59374.1 fimbrial assembly protein [Citrobacter amalonaticus]POT77504.1 fimbrial assembly protein [Citrobacter amalonaticus]POU67956.1 fimbrial assembly protein [Citrobacter amalonaticus]POV07560.1 fimbrial assembly protein [Citrobacter amalonaticus]
MAVWSRQLSGVVMTALLTSTTLCRAEPGDDALPPPPDARSINEQAVFHLGLIVNHYDTQQVISVIHRDGDYIVASADLKQAGLPADKLPPGEINLSRMAQVKAEYDSSGQRLLLTVPRDWLPARITPFGGEAAESVAQNGSGALFNYDFYTSHTQQGEGQASLWHELRVFNDAGSLSSTGYVRQNLAGSDTQQEGYVRYDTVFTVTEEENATQWRAGDVISDALSWSNSVRVGGLSWGRDFTLRPDLVTWPLPEFSGEAAVPTAADLFINGYRAGSTNLQPGPFTLTNLPYINGAGDAVLVTRDALGRQVSTTLPFYVASNLLRSGISDGALTVGSLRRNYGIENFDYGPAVGSATYRYGATDFLTLEGHGEGAEALALGGGGALVKLGQFGVVNGAWSESRMRGNRGNQINWGYQYNTAAFSVATQHTRRERGFGNLALYDRSAMTDDDNQPLASLSQRSDQYSLTVNMGTFGNIGAAWIGIRSFDAQKTELLNLSWSRNLWGSSSLYLAASRDQQQGDWTLAMSVQIPLGERDSAAFSMEKTPDAGQTQRINYNHSMPTDGGLSWNLAWARQSQDSNYQQATLGWRNNSIELQGGTYGESDQMTWWGEAMGSLVLMDNQLFAANKINDAFVVVSTDGQANVPVNYENQPVGKTNEHGYLLISGVSAYYPARYSINTLNLPADTRLKETERKVALRRLSGYLVDFPMEQEQVASLILHDEQGRVLPVASQVMRGERGTAVVGYDGIVWLENLDAVNPLQVVTPEGKRCRVTLTLTPNPAHKLKTYGPLVCREDGV